MKRLLSACLALALAVSTLAVVPATTAAADGDYFCFDTQKPYYSIVDRPNTGQPSVGGYLQVKMNAVYVDLKTCKGSPNTGTSEFFLTLQDFEGGSSAVVQVGWMTCGVDTCDLYGSGDIHDNDRRFIVSANDNSSDGNLVVFSGAPPLVSGHTYTIMISADNSGATNYWDISIKDVSTGVSGAKSIVKDWRADYFWFGCEVYNRMDYCGYDNDISPTLTVSAIKYYGVDTGWGVQYTLNDATCEFPQADSAYGWLWSTPVMQVLERDCWYNSDHSTINFRTKDD